MSIEVDGRRQRGIASRTAILDAAERLFSEGGFRSTSVRTIAASIGMSHAGVLKHFPHKGDLLAAILERLESGEDALALAAAADISPRERYRLIATRTLTPAAAVHLRIVLLGEATDENHPARDYLLGLLGYIEQTIDQLFDVDPVESLALWNGLQLIWLYVPDELDAVAVADSYFVSQGREHPVGPPARVSARPTRPAETGDSRVEQIVSAASDAIARGGYRSTSLRDIAQVVGLTHSALLYHFPAKVDLLTAVLEHRDRAGALPWQWEATALDFLNGLYLQAVANERRPDLARLFTTLVCEATDPAHPVHGYFRDRYREFHANLSRALAELVREGLARPDIDPDVEAHVLIGLWEGLGLRALYRDDPVGLPERLRARMNSLLTVTLGHVSASDASAVI